LLSFFVENWDKVYLEYKKKAMCIFGEKKVKSLQD